MVDIDDAPQKIAEKIRGGRTALGIEFGSTRIKAVLIDDTYRTIASGDYQWASHLEDGLWSYSKEEIWKGLQSAYASMADDVYNAYGERLTFIGHIGFSAMMHGYLAFDKAGELLVPFRTWRNTTTGEAAAALTKAFDFNIPQRWSIAHLYQAMLNGEDHVGQITYLTTLAGYIHWKMTGEKVLGVGEASGMFPIDSQTVDYDEKRVEIFDDLIETRGYPWKLRQILPKVRKAGEKAGVLTEEGAKLLDPTGELEAGIPLCPPEGDAGTGMTATNSVREGTGNVSAGTSVFAMVVLKEALKTVHEELDLVTTPSGEAVAMVHCNNCTSDLNAWVGLFKEIAENLGISVDRNELYGMLYRKALEGKKDCGGMVSYNYVSGEPVTGMMEGRPLFMRMPDTKLNLADFMRTHLYGSLAALKVGLDILLKEEQVTVDKIYGHGGLFKTPLVGQKILAAAMNAPVTVMKTAGEGGPWGMAVRAFYMLQNRGEGLADYLNQQVFADETGETVEPDPEDVRGFDAYMEVYKKGLQVEAAAVESLLF